MICYHHIRTSKGACERRLTIQLPKGEDAISIKIPTWDPSRPGHILLDLLKDEVRSRGTPGPERIREIAELTGSTVAKVQGVIGYYSELKPVDHSIRVCLGESCRARGAEDLVSTLIDSGETVGTLHCAGLCVCGPATLHDEAEIIPASCDGTSLQFHLSMDSASLAIGAEDVAAELLLHLGETDGLNRTGSRGLFHLEPMIEVDLHDGRHCFGPIEIQDVQSVVQAISEGNSAQHPMSLGLVDSIPEMASQTRFAMSRLGVVDPLNLDSARASGAYVGLGRAKEIGAESVLSELEQAGLRGRGGAGFPTHFKWKSAMQESDPIKHIVANADEGDAGTFIDRMLMEGDPHSLIEGMLICSEVIGGTQGWVYLRSEYPQAKRILQSAIDSAREDGLLGEHFDIEIALGAGSYVCGEETALLESLEGRRGEVRARPPYPTESGLYGHPTIVNNVLTFAMAAAAIREGGSVMGNLGTSASKGTVVAQISGDVPLPTCVEVPFGDSVSDLFKRHSSLEGITAIQVGGPLGSVFTREELDTIELSFEGLTSAGGILGHGGFVCYGSGFDPHTEVISWMRFFRDESCGKCTPCRIGTQRALELLQRIGTDAELPGDRVLLTDLDDVMTSTSLCALGGLAMNPVRSTIQRWPASFGGESNE